MSRGSRDRFTFTCVLKAYTGTELVALGQALHCDIAHDGLVFDVLMCDALVYLCLMLRHLEGSACVRCNFGEGQCLMEHNA